MSSNIIGEDKVVAAILTVAWASSKPSASIDDILAMYKKVFSEVRPKQAEKSIETVPESTPIRRFRD